MSIIIPTHSPDHYLYECLDSVALQTFDQENLEVILVLNGPKQPFFKSISDYAQKVEKLNLVITYCENAHVSSARNMGIELARGNYLIFIDDDDLISTLFVEDLYSRAIENGVVFSNFLHFDVKPERATKNNLSFTYDNNVGRTGLNWMTLRSHMSMVSGKLIPSSIIKNYRFDMRFKNGQDSLYMALISCEIKTYVLSSTDAIYYWRNRKDSASRKPKKVSYEVKNTILLMRAYIRIYLSKPTEYNILFFISRLLAAIKRLKHRIPRSSW